MSTSPATVTVVQHLSFEDLGSLESVFLERGHAIEYVQAGVDDVGAAIDGAQYLVVLGGPIGVYEADRYPFLNDELAALTRRLQAQRPTLGICLGAQLMASALGARVYPGGTKEIGFSPLTLTPSGLDSPLCHLQDVAVLHWHGDTFDIPLGAQCLASSAVYPHQAFAVGRHALALQFHIEAQARTFERWLIGHTAELSAAGLDVTTLRQQAHQYGPALEPVAAAVLRDWLDLHCRNQQQVMSGCEPD